MDFMISFKDQTIHSKKLSKAYRFRKTRNSESQLGITKTVFCMQQMKIIRECINGTSQYYMKNSKLINTMENSGYKGIKKWMEQCEKDTAGIKVKVRR